MRSLADRYEAFLLDLDGVLYRGDEVLPGVVETTSRLRAGGKRLGFITNNSARTPDEVAGRLTALGVDAAPEEVVTSALVTAERLRGTASTAYVVGERGVRHALTEAGIDVLDGAPDEADVVVVGWDRSVDYERLRVASVLVGRGARLVATNADPSYPAPGGDLWPGAGALLAAVETATGVQGEAFGKPARALFDVALERIGTRSCLVVGDRLDTDAAGAGAAGLDAALVLTGAATLAALAEHDARPVAVLSRLGELLESRPRLRIRRATGGEARPLVEDAGLPGEGGPEEALVGEDDDVLATASVAVGDGLGYLHSVAVRGDVRGLHLGALLTGAALRRAAEEGAARAVLLTEQAAGFFERLGFVRTERDVLPGWVRDRAVACSATAVAMERPLRSATPAGR